MMRLKCPWEDNPLAALTRVRARRQLQQLPGSKYWPWLVGCLAWYLALTAPWHYPLFLGVTFVALFLTLPGYFFQREMAQLKSLRHGRCLEEMLAVGLTPQGIADTLAWSSWSGLARLSVSGWLLAASPSLWLCPDWLMLSGLALPAGLLVTGLSAYLRQVLLVLADRPAHMWRGGLQLYAMACLCLAPPLAVFLYRDLVVGEQLGLLGLTCLWVWVRGYAISLWRQDLAPQSRLPGTPSWGSWLVKFFHNPILVRELRKSRGYSLFLWGGLPLLVLASVGLAVAPMTGWFGCGSGFFLVWVVWRLVNFSALADRSHGLLQEERQRGSWELLVQVGLAGPEFVRGWAQATMFRHFGWMLADLVGLLVMAQWAPEWMIPGGSRGLALVWALCLWGLGLLMDWSAFVVGLAGRKAWLLSSLVVAGGFGELMLFLPIGLGWLDSSSQLFDFAWRQGVPALALLVVMMRLLFGGQERLAEVLDPLNRCRRPSDGSECLPQRAAQGVWVLWLLSSPSLSVWRDQASTFSLLVTMGVGCLVWGWLFQPWAWALYPLRQRLRLARGSWLGPLLTGQLVGALSAIPVVCAVEIRNLYWMVSGQTFAGIEATHPVTDMPGAMLVGIAAVWLIQFYRWAFCTETGGTVCLSYGRLRLVALATLSLAGLGSLAVGQVFPTHLTPSEQRWWSATQTHLQQRDDIAVDLERVRDHFPLNCADEADEMQGTAEEIFGQNLCCARWTAALDDLLSLDWLQLYLVLHNRQSDSDAWLTALDMLEQEPPDAATLRQMVVTLQGSLERDQNQQLVDEFFCQSEQLSGSPGWWPQALLVARTRQYLQGTGRFEQPAPPWVKAHPGKVTAPLGFLSQSRAWRELLVHRCQMALGQAEWPAVHPTAGGEVLLVTQVGGTTTYWLAGLAETTAPVEVVVNGQKRVSQLPATRLYTVP